MAHALYVPSPGRREFRQLPAPPMQNPLPASSGFWSAAASIPLPEGVGEHDEMIPPSPFPTVSVHVTPENALAINAQCSSRDRFAELRRYSVIQRSLSSQSLELQSAPLLLHKSAPFQPFLRSPAENSTFKSELSDIQSGSIRRVFSTGDLQRICSEHESGSPFGHENFGNGVQKVARYNAEEKKERIQRYRSKRNQRNFNKKITYACRKTLADSRPRVRGRFARNEEHGESSAQIQWTQIEDHDDDENWIHLFDGNYAPVP